MSALARAAGGGHHLVVLEGHQVAAAGRAVLRQKSGAVEAHARLLVDQVRAEVGGEGALHQEHVLAVERGGCHLSVRRRVHASGIDDFACKS